ncbi:MAG: response regulator [Lachnospiraceae bacterium]|nr:response regulator [Lachnospiraceae bacterium]
MVISENNNSKPNVLVVDDVVINLEILAEIVKSNGYIARTVTSVAQAQEAIKELLPQLILLDISMPDMNGFDFCEILKADPKTRDIPVIFVTAMTSLEDKKKGFSLGAVDFISKPFDPDEVSIRVNTQVKNYQMKQELENYNKRLHKTMMEQVKKVSDDQKNLIFSLVKLAESREDPSGMHIENVSYNARLLAQSLQFSLNYEKEISNSFIEEIEIAAPLHDIGNLAISDRVLLKQDSLSEEEMALVKTHAEIGAMTLMEIYSQNEYSNYIKMAIDIAFYHHERWDGMGYPKGLLGSQIPLSARIVSVVDVYDTLIREKTYKKALTHEEAMVAINDDAGKRFDPGIVDVLNKIQGRLRRD